MFFNHANILTLVRIGLAFLFLALFYSPNLYVYYFAVFVFIMGAITDLLDGHIARSQKQVSEFGKLLDPLADKILLCSGLFPLVEQQLFPVWIAVVIVTREFAVSGLRTLAARKKEIIAASRQGKYKTTFQLSIVITILVIHGFKMTLIRFFGPLEQLGETFSFWQPDFFWWLNVEIEFLIWGTLIITVLSGLDYFRRNIYLFEQPF